jgi:hypothetical protein
MHVAHLHDESAGYEAHSLMKSLVTALTEFIGSHPSECLLDGGHEVVGVDGFPDFTTPRSSV